MDTLQNILCDDGRIASAITAQGVQITVEYHRPCDQKWDFYLWYEEEKLHAPACMDELDSLHHHWGYDREEMAEELMQAYGLDVEAKIWQTVCQDCHQSGALYQKVGLVLCEVCFYSREAPETARPKGEGEI